MVQLYLCSNLLLAALISSKLFTAGLAISTVFVLCAYYECLISSVRGYRTYHAYETKTQLTEVDLARANETVRAAFDAVIDQSTKFKARRPLLQTAEQTISAPSYIPLRRMETAHVDCGRVLRGDIAYTVSIVINRPTLIRDNKVSDCREVRARVLPSMEFKIMEFGMAHARVVYRDYEFIEDELRSSYHPQNYFCYSVDQKASRKFRWKINNLALCFPNVFVTPAQFDFDENGHFMNHAHYQCMQLLMQKRGWEYIILLQNHDVIIKSTYEMEKIYKLLDGANDVEITPCPEDRWDHSKRWDAYSLNLFKDRSAASLKQLVTTLNFAKGAAQASLSRAAVDWLVNVANLTTLINQLNEKPFGIDEILLQSLQISDTLEMPGRFTAECLMQGKNTSL